MNIGQKVKTIDSRCEARVYQIKGDKVRIRTSWYSKLHYISDFHQFDWFDKCLIEPLLES